MHDVPAPRPRRGRPRNDRTQSGIPFPRADPRGSARASRGSELNAVQLLLPIGSRGVSPGLKFVSFFLYAEDPVGPVYERLASSACNTILTHVSGRYGRISLHTPRSGGTCLITSTTPLHSTKARVLSSYERRHTLTIHLVRRH